MTVKELKEIINDYNEDAKVVVVDWSTGREYNFSIGGDDVDEGEKYCRIGLD